MERSDSVGVRDQRPRSNDRKQNLIARYGGPLRIDTGILEAVLVVTGCLDGPFG
jgi:hypothetical protein